MTLLPLQHPARSAGHAQRSEAHENGGRDSGERGNEAGGKLRLSTLDRVEGEASISVSKRFDAPKTGYVNIGHGERLRKNCAVAIHSASPSLFSGSIEARNFEPANHTSSSSRPMVNEWSPWAVRQEYRP